ncbi:sigma-E processing peptidase SpoIIGA [Candidatus Epulonipiscium viviparus]|uniref:sigma-E processing peptidase SpoIIGA n=1 Tax=Candidatus Epulonipiscium viviparus TaxID=420336 RepID=UPI00016C0A4A|nr:sigma-E processing peptidase SpoIIGA [Candidatus Epulopiscium viviparus]
MQVIYIDVLFFINFIMDIFIFFTGSLLYIRVPFKKLLLASTIAALLSCLVIIFPNLERLSFNLYYIFLPCIPIILLYGTKNFFKAYLINFLCACIIGGVALSVYFQCSFVMGNEASLILTILCGAVISFLTYYFLIAIRKKFLLIVGEAYMSFELYGNTVNLKGIVDTGNTLYTVFSKEPVAIVQLDKVRKFLAIELLDFIEEIDAGKESLRMLDKASLIPFNSVGCKSGLIVGVKVSNVTVKRGSKIYVHRNAIIGLSSELFKEDINVLIHPDLVN